MCRAHAVGVPAANADAVVVRGLLATRLAESQLHPRCFVHRAFEGNVALMMANANQLVDRLCKFMMVL